MTPVIHFLNVAREPPLPLCGNPDEDPTCTTNDRVVTCHVCVARLREIVDAAADDRADGDDPA